LINLSGFLDSLIGRKFTTDSVSFTHNIFVLSNNIDREINDYFLSVLGAKDVNLELKNLSSTNAFEYFSQEYLGVVAKVATGSEQ